MTKTISFLFAIIISLTGIAQNFEGKITYSNTYKSKMPSVTNEQFTSMMGTTQNYSIKEGNYKSETNGTMIQWQLYVNSDNKLYNKMVNSETLLWNDGAANTDEVITGTINKGVTTILGYKCDELVLTCKSGIQKYYFNTAIPVDPKLYTNHKYGNWFEVLSRTNAIPLKMIIETEQFSFESTATVITPLKLDQKVFELPAGVKTMKSPY